MSNTHSMLLPHGIEAAIFDFDGTLADTAQIWYEVDNTFLMRRGIAYPADYPERLAALGFVEGARYTIERFGLSETVEEVCAEWQHMSQDLYRQRVTLRPGAERFIRMLRERGIPCALATTNAADVIFGLDHVNAKDLFDTCVFGADVKRGKDHPDIYLEAARRLEVSPEHVLVFEDIVPALLSAKRAGMLACGVRANDAHQNVERVRAVADLWLDDWMMVSSLISMQAQQDSRP